MQTSDHAHARAIGLSVQHKNIAKHHQTSPNQTSPMVD